MCDKHKHKVTCSHSELKFWGQNLKFKMVDIGGIHRRGHVVACSSLQLMLAL